MGLMGERDEKLEPCPIMGSISEQLKLALQDFRSRTDSVSHHYKPFSSTMPRLVPE